MKQYILIKAKNLLVHYQIFDEAVHIDKRQVPFNALSKKGQLITVCSRATYKDRLIK